MKRRFTVSFSVVAVFLLVLGCSNSISYDGFASCLTEKGVKMYGTFWCPHCLEQKKIFGDSIQYVNYVECSLPDGKSQTEYCQNREIEGYPTWELENGTRLNGVVSLEDLSVKSGCVLG